MKKSRFVFQALLISAIVISFCFCASENKVKVLGLQEEILKLDMQTYSLVSQNLGVRSQILSLQKQINVENQKDMMAQITPLRTTLSKNREQIKDLQKQAAKQRDELKGLLSKKEIKDELLSEPK